MESLHLLIPFKVIGGLEDKLIWNVSKKGIFPVKSYATSLCCQVRYIKRFAYQGNPPR